MKHWKKLNGRIPNHLSCSAIFLSDSSEAIDIFPNFRPNMRTAALIRQLLSDVNNN